MFLISTASLQSHCGIIDVQISTLLERDFVVTIFSKLFFFYLREIDWPTGEWDWSLYYKSFTLQSKTLVIAVSIQTSCLSGRVSESAAQKQPHCCFQLRCWATDGKRKRTWDSRQMMKQQRQDEEICRTNNTAGRVLVLLDLLDWCETYILST